MSQPKNVDEYISSQPKYVRERLQAIRQTIKSAAPNAQEKLSYGMPYYSLNGRLIYFAAHQNHIGIYPMPAGVKAFEAELKPYKTAKATIRLPNDQPLPLGLIRRVVEFRAMQNLSKHQ